MGQPPAFEHPPAQQYPAFSPGPAAPHGPFPAPQAPVWPPPAPFGRRLGAYAIDGVICLPLFLVVYLTVGVGGAVTMSSYVGSEGLAALMVLLALLLAPLSCFCYFWLPTGRSGQTLGKRFLKIKVVDAATGQPPSPGKAFGRTAVMFLLNLLSVGTVLNAVLTVIDEPRQRSLHDRAATTRVVPA